jgi:hypothetical protein
MVSFTLREVTPLPVVAALPDVVCIGRRSEVGPAASNRVLRMLEDVGRSSRARSELRALRDARSEFTYTVQRQDRKLAQ